MTAWRTGSSANTRPRTAALISNNIHTIVPRADGTLLLGTENSVALFRRESGTFRNWTAEQGLASVCLNAGVSTFRHGESFVFGSNTGAVMFPPT